MGRLWQVLSIDLPWAVSNWLWANIVHPLNAGVLQLTPRRTVYLVIFAIFAVAFVCAAAEMALPGDIALLMAGDSALYFEIATFAWLAIAANRMHRMAAPAIRALRTAVQHTRRGARTRRPLRLPRLFDKEDSGDLPDGAFAY